jgi:hypothetical protein
MMTDMLTIEPVMLFIGVGIAGCALFAARPWHEPEEWREAPVEIRAFMWFSLVVVVVEFVILGALSDLRDSWNPYLGRGQMFVYLFGAPVAMTLCRARANRVRWILIGFIGLWVVMSLWRFWSHPERPGETDPSRMVSPSQLIWTVLIPLVWMAVLLSPRVKRYCSSTGAVAT